MLKQVLVAAVVSIAVIAIVFNSTTLRSTIAAS